MVLYSSITSVQALLQILHSLKRARNKIGASWIHVEERQDNRLRNCRAHLVSRLPHKRLNRIDAIITIDIDCFVHQDALEDFKHTFAKSILLLRTKFFQRLERFAEQVRRVKAPRLSNYFSKINVLLACILARRVGPFHGIEYFRSSIP